MVRQASRRASLTSSSYALHASWIWASRVRLRQYGLSRGMVLKRE